MGLLPSRPHRLARPRTPPFHGGNAGSNPAGDAILAIPYGTSADLPYTLRLPIDHRNCWIFSHLVTNPRIGIVNLLCHGVSFLTSRSAQQVEAEVAGDRQQALMLEPPRWRRSAPILADRSRRNRELTPWHSRLDYSCERNGPKPEFNCCSLGVRGLIVSPLL